MPLNITTTPASSSPNGEGEIPTPTTREPAWITERLVERQLRAILVQVIGASARCLVTGPRGIGKSRTTRVLLDSDLRQLAGDRAAPWVIYCPLIRATTPRDTFLAIASQAGYQTLVDRAKKHRSDQDQLRGDLLSAMQQQSQVVLIIDQAHQLEEAAIKAILDLLAEADHRADQERRPHWLGLLLIASTPDHRRLLSRIGEGERVQAFTELLSDTPEELAQTLYTWLPELKQDARLADPVALAAWISIRLRQDAPTLRALSDLARAHMALTAHHVQRGQRSAASNVALLDALSRQYIGHHQRALALTSSGAPMRSPRGTKKPAGGQTP